MSLSPRVLQSFQVGVWGDLNGGGGGHLMFRSAGWRRELATGGAIRGLMIGLTEGLMGRLTGAYGKASRRLMVRVIGASCEG